MDNTKQETDHPVILRYALANKPEFKNVNGRCYLVDHLIVVRQDGEKPICRNCGSALTKNGHYLKTYCGILPEPLEEQWQTAEKKINCEQNCAGKSVGVYETAFLLQRWSCPVCRKAGKTQNTAIDFPDFLAKYYRETKETFIADLEEDAKKYFEIDTIDDIHTAVETIRGKNIYYEYIVCGKRKNEDNFGGLSYRLLRFIQYYLKGAVKSLLDYYTAIRNKTLTVNGVGR